MFYSALHIVPSKPYLATISFREITRKTCKETDKLSLRIYSMRLSGDRKFDISFPYGPSSYSSGVNNQVSDPGEGDNCLSAAYVFRSTLVVSFVCFLQLLPPVKAVFIFLHMALRRSGTKHQLTTRP